MALKNCRAFITKPTARSHGMYWIKPRLHFTFHYRTAAGVGPASRSDPQTVLILAYLELKIVVVHTYSKPGRLLQWVRVGEWGLGQVVQLVRASIPMHQGFGFNPPSGHIQESTHECIDKWNNKSMSPPIHTSSLSLSNQKYKKKKVTE